jgi:hypothetical protein
LCCDWSVIGRGRENKENEKNLEEGREGYRRGGGRMMNGPGRSGRGGRGGGRLGPRTFQNRDKGGFPRSIETWNNPGADENTGESLRVGKFICFCIDVTVFKFLPIPSVEASS